MKGNFISFEGLDGSGKTSVISYISDFLQSQGIESIQTREPGGTEQAESIRNLLLSDSMQGIQGETEVLMMFASRKEHLHNKIIPALNVGKWVLCDRFTDSTFAYQSLAQGVSSEFIENIANLIHPSCWPTRTYWLNITVSEAEERVNIKGKQNRFDENGFCFQEKVHLGYQKQFEKHSKRIVKIDASQSINLVSKQIIDDLNKLINLK